VTDRRTDGLAVTSTALAMLALPRAVKIIPSCKGGAFFETQCSICKCNMPLLIPGTHTMFDDLVSPLFVLHSCTVFDSA